MPQALMQELTQVTSGEAICATDVGQHQMWAAQYYPVKHGRSWLTSGGLGTMGYGLPAAMGAAFGNRDRTVMLITGDGSFQMTLQELATCVAENLNLKVVIMNNGCLGMVRQWQELFYSRRYSEVGMRYFPDFVKIAEAYGAKVFARPSPKSSRACSRKASATPGVVVMDIIVSEEENVYPMIPAGAAHYEIVMQPEADKDPTRTKRSGMKAQARTLGSGREPLRRAGARGRALRRARLQHRFARRQRHDRSGVLADRAHDARQRSHRRADREAAPQAHPREEGGRHVRHRHIERELCVVTVQAGGPKARQELERVVSLTGARVIAYSQTAFTVEATATSQEIDQFLELLRPLGIRDMVRSAPIAIARPSVEAASEAPPSVGAA